MRASDRLRTPDVAVAVAKEFSPRLQRYGRDCVVLDVGGLGRLLGEPPAIGAELASRIAELSAERGSLIFLTGRGSRGSLTFLTGHGSRGSLILLRDRSARSASREKDQRSVRVAVAPTQIGALLLSSAYPGLTVVTGDIASALAPVRLEVLRHVLGEIHDVTLLRHERSAEIRVP